jgi:tRNA1(Val) A37 N6-methylase TrmN6
MARNKCDFYATPIDTITNLLNHLDLTNYGPLILEPSAGNGNISKLIKTAYPNKHLTSLEIRSEEEQNLQSCSDEVIICDYLQYDTKSKYDIIITNPPYSLAIEFVKKSLSLLNDKGILVLLLRTAFLESKRKSA